MIGRALLKSAAALLLSFAAVLGVPSAAQAQRLWSIDDREEAAPEHPFSVRVGYGFATYDTSGKASVFGQPVPNAQVAFEQHSSAIVEAGWRVSPSWSVSLLSGLPPTASLHGRGAFAPLGVLSKVTYGSVMLGAQYHPFNLGRFDPYIGAGLDYTFIWSTKGGSLPDLRAKESLGPILQAGFDVAITERLSFYADFRKIWVDFRAKATVPDANGPYPIRVVVSPNPTILSFGVSYRF